MAGSIATVPLLSPLPPKDGTEGGTGEGKVLQHCHRGHLMFVQRHCKGIAVLFGKILADHKGQGPHACFHIVLFFFVNAQPEHELAFSRRPDLYFTDPHHRVLAFVLQQCLKALRRFVSYRNIHFILIGWCEPLPPQA